MVLLASAHVKPLFATDNLTKSVGEGVITPPSVQFAQNESLDRESQAKALVTIPKELHDVRLKAKTPAGAAFVEKYLHPPGECLPDFQGIPDRNTTENVDYEWRLSEELNYNQWHTALAGATAVLILSPPSVYRQRFVFATDGNTFAQVQSENAPNPDVSITSFNANVETWRMTYCSDTFEQDANALNNAGMLYSTQFRPDVTEFAFNTFQELEKGLGKYAKHKGHLELRTALAKKLSSMAFSDIGDSVKVEKVGESTPGLSVQVINLGVLPLKPSDLLMKSSKSTSWRSTIGSFMVHRFSEPTQRYISQTRGYTTIPVSGGSVTSPGVSAYTICLYETYNPATDTWTLSTFQGSEAGTYCIDVSKWYDMTWSALLYDFSAQINASGTLQAVPGSLVHKKIFGIETTPPFGSMSLAQRRQRALLDQEAMDIISTADQLKSDALPAAANAFGGIMASLAKFAPAVLSTLSSLFSAGKDQSPSREPKIENRMQRLEDSLSKMLPVVTAAAGGALNAVKKQQKRNTKQVKKTKTAQK